MHSGSPGGIEGARSLGHQAAPRQSTRQTPTSNAEARSRRLNARPGLRVGQEPPSSPRARCMGITTGNTDYRNQNGRNRPALPSKCTLRLHAFARSAPRCRTRWRPCQPGNLSPSRDHPNAALMGQAGHPRGLDPPVSLLGLGPIGFRQESVFDASSCYRPA